MVRGRGRGKGRGRGRDIRGIDEEGVCFGKKKIVCFTWGQTFLFDGVLNAFFFFFAMFLLLFAKSSPVWP